MKNLRLLLLINLFLALPTLPSQAESMSGGDYFLTKDLLGTSGSTAMGSSEYSIAFAWGESAAGNTHQEPTYLIISGYYGGRFGNGQTFAMRSARIGAAEDKPFYQDNLRVGVAFDAPIEVIFSDQLDESTLANGLKVTRLIDHLGAAANTVASIQWTVDPVRSSLTIHPASSWDGNSLYDIEFNPKLCNIDGFPLEETAHVYFVTLLDHRQENVVVYPLRASAAFGAVAAISSDSLSIRIPPNSLGDYSALIHSRDPIQNPLRVDPQIIQEANRKALASVGPYRSPLWIEEINAYNAKGEWLGPLSRPAEITIDYGAGALVSGSPAGLIRPQTLALWVLDETHHLWVKIPGNRNSPALGRMTTPVAHFSVFALMGGPEGSAADSYVFPVPWRPHGPKTGGGIGQTGTDADGLIFTNLPSECSIKIYTLAGDLVREIHHSDTGGVIAQERWDATTTHGDKVASGVYLWRVESSVDAQSGKLMIIR
jgi:hypothetical protein